MAPKHWQCGEYARDHSLDRSTPVLGGSALAVIDDLGTIIVIAIFYSSGVALTGLGVAALALAGSFVMQRLSVGGKAAYVFPAFVAWSGVYAAGIHPTIAGAVLGLVTPVRAWLGPEGFLVGVRRELDDLAQKPINALSSHELAATLRHGNRARR